MLRAATLRWLLRKYEREQSVVVTKTGLFIAHLLKSLYQADENRYRRKSEEYNSVVNRLTLLIFEMEIRKETTDEQGRKEP